MNDYINAHKERSQNSLCENQRRSSKQQTTKRNKNRGNLTLFRTQQTVLSKHTRQKNWLS